MNEALFRCVSSTFLMSDQDKLAELQDNRAEPVIFSDFHSVGVSGP